MSNRRFNERPSKPIVKPPPQDLQTIAHLVLKELGAGHGFVVLTFPLTDSLAGCRYVSNGSRESVMKLLREFVEKEGDK